MKHKLALIEDEQPILELYRLKFEEEGYEVAIAKNGIEGMDLIEAFEPHVVLLDIMMPTMGGLKMIDTIQKKGREMPPTIILTNMGYEEVIQKATDLGVTDVYVKVEITPGQLADRVAEILA